MLLFKVAAQIGPSQGGCGQGDAFDLGAMCTKDLKFSYIFSFAFISICLLNSNNPFLT